MDPHVLLLSEEGKLFDASDTIDYRDTIFFAHDASSGDINGDGYPDILAARTLFLNNSGTGFVNSIESLPEGMRRTDHYVMSSLLKDFNGLAKDFYILTISMNFLQVDFLWIPMDRP